MAQNAKKICRALNKALEDARQETKISVSDNNCYVIFSDHHKGARNRADDFVPAEKNYLAALPYYFHNDYTLINLGDSEEMWEEREERVIASYTNVLEEEARFYHEGRYLKAYGNHDSQWAFDSKVEVYLYRFFPKINIREGFLLEYNQDGRKQGELFLAHGHQGTLGSDQISLISMYAVRFFWRAWQNLTGRGYTTPSQDACLRATHDTIMYEWAQEKEKLIFIAGHTHRPIWSSKTHLEQLMMELRQLQQNRPPQPAPPSYHSEIAHLQARIKDREEKYPPCDDSIKVDPCYFNTGCCSFSDGDITGIEIAHGEIRLIKWTTDDDGRPERVVLERALLTDLFSALS